MIAEPLSVNELKKFFPKKAERVIDYFLLKAIFSQPEALPGESLLPLQVTKEHVEQWLVHSLGAKSVGAGRYAIDLIGTLEKEEYGADAKMLSWDNITKTGRNSKKLSGETSLCQNFSDQELDIKFKDVDKQKDEIVANWKKYLNIKFDEVINGHKKMKSIYYFFLIREKDLQEMKDQKGRTFHLCGMKVEVEGKFEELEAGEVTKKKKSVFVTGFIDEKYGNVKVYSSKRRMELRLRPRAWIDEKLVITFNPDEKSFNPKKKLLGLSEAELRSHAIKQFTSLFE